MSQTNFDFPSIYNPAKQTDEEILANFVIRLKEFEELFSVIRNDKMLKPSQHFIIQGQRGYGKTTLLLRLNIEIQNNQELKSWLIPMLFDEEQYSVHTLVKLWEEVIDNLSVADDSFKLSTNDFDVIYDSDNPEEKMFALLMKLLKKQNKKLILFLDNFGEMVDKFTRKELQRLREVLITCKYIRIVATSSMLLESFFNYREPFFDFFKVITLDELNREETIQLLLKLGETYGGTEISKVIEIRPERIEALRRLTGGVPRTIVLLYKIFIDNAEGNSFKDLERILDLVTPLYKHRLDSLSTQQQAIVDAVSQNWDAMSTKEISKKVRMPGKAIASQLQQLEKNQIVIKIGTSTKNNLYQIQERFFNIYYLMRLVRRKNRNRVLWLVRFLEIWCGKTELITRAKAHINSLNNAGMYEKHAYYITQALARTSLPLNLQDDLLKKAREFLSAKKSSLIMELDKSHLEVLREAEEDISNGKIELAIKKLKGDGHQENEIEFFIGFIFKKKNDFQSSEKYYRMATEKGEANAMNNLALLYSTEKKDFESAKKYYLMAIKKGHVKAMNNLAFLYETEKKDFESAKKYYLIAIEKGDDSAMNNLAVMYQTEKKDFESAKEYYLMAIAEGNLNAINNLAFLYETEKKDFESAEKYYLMAIEKGHVKAMNNLAFLYDIEKKDFESAEKYYLMAIEKGHVKAMNNLARLYFEFKKNRSKALSLQMEALENNQDRTNAAMLIMIFLWNDEIENAIQKYETFFCTEKTQREVNEMIQFILLMFLAKKQYHYVHNLFQKNQFDIRDKYKPIYYTVLKLLGEKYSDDFKKMPPEMKQTVEEILEEVDQMSKDYA